MRYTGYRVDFHLVASPWSHPSMYRTCMNDASPAHRPGFYDFKSITSEVSATPLLDVQVAPDVDDFTGVQYVHHATHCLGHT